MVRVKPFRNLTSSTKEKIMSHAAFKSVEIEETTSNKNINNSKLFTVPAARISLGSQVTRRVTEVVDFELANGSMPA
jgi:hypothetical protein